MKNLRNQFRPAGLAVLFLALGFSLSACGDDTPGDDMSRVRGRVDGFSGSGLPDAPSFQAVEGAAVTLARIQGDGSFLVVSSAEATTDAGGRFTVDTELDGERNLVVTATKGGVEYRAILAATVEHGRTVTAPPLDEESTVEAELYARIVARGSTDLVTVADLAGVVDADLADRIRLSPAARDRVILALEEGGRARAAMLADDAFDLSPPQFNTIRHRRQEARAKLDQELYLAGSSQSAIAAAREGWYDSEADAWAEAEAGLGVRARWAEVAAAATRRGGAELSLSDRTALERSLATIRAEAISRAVDDQAVRLGADAAERAMLTAAGAALRTGVAAAVTTAAIDAAFATYHEAAVDGLQAILETHQAALATADLALMAPAGARATLDAAIDASLTAQALVDAYAAFFGAADALVRSALAGATPVQADAGVEVMTLAVVAA